MSPRAVGADVQFATGTDVSKALKELVQTLDWMHDRLQYSEQQVKRTHAYKAFVLLGGVWP